MRDEIIIAYEDGYIHAIHNGKDSYEISLDVAPHRGGLQQVRLL